MKGPSGKAQTYDLTDIKSAHLLTHKHADLLRRCSFHIAMDLDAWQIPHLNYRVRSSCQLGISV